MAKKEQTVASIDEIFSLIRAGERQTGIELLYSLHYNKLYGIAFLFVKKPTGYRRYCSQCDI